jgi:fructose-specific PTS system IIA-like component
MIMAARRRPVIIRAIDVGGDKPLPYLALPHEDNPFLGRRGIRLYPDHLELVDAQIRAVLRASAHGPVKLMAPMVTTVEEGQWFRNRVVHWQKDLNAKGVLLDPAMPVGMMVEVPASALMLDHMCGIFDFFSYGTNDLLQYWQAADRGNPRVGNLYNHRHPSFFRLLRRSIWEANARGRWVGICGDMATDPAMLPLLQALGFNEISVPVAEIPVLRAARAGLSKIDGRNLLERVCRCGTIAEVDMVLAAAAPAASGAQVSPEMISLNSSASTQAEAIRELVDLMHEHGRTKNPDAVEEAIWAREQVSTTGFGHGIAIPHCKMDAVAVNTLGVLKLATPIAWNSIDGQPVSTVILLASHNDKVDNVHMQIFAKLCRQLMHEEFRAGLAAATDAASLCAFLKNDLKC